MIDRTYAGIPLKIENPAGSVRSGIDADGKPWSVTMNHDYGYISRAKGADGEGLDVFANGPCRCSRPPEEKDVYVIHQNRPDTGEYDEDKVMLGFHGPDEAKAAYLSNYNRPDFYRSTTIIPMARFKEMLTSGEPGGAAWKVKQRRAHATAAMFSNPAPSMGHPFYLCSLGSALTEADPGSLPKEVSGQPCKYFWGRGLKIGKVYIHPVKKWEMSVSRPFADGLADNFRKMAANGVKVPIVDDHVEKAANSRGYMVGVREQDGWVEPLLQFIGEDAIRMAARNEISFGIMPFTDGEGHEYGLCVTHVAITPSPVVPNQQGLRAASRGQNADAPPPDVFHLAASPNPPSTMLNCSLTPEHVATIKRMCGMADGDDASPDMLMSRFMDKAKGLSAAHEQTGTAHQKLVADHEKLLKDHQSLVAKHDEQTKLMSRNAPEANAEVIGERRLRMKDRLERLVGRFTPADVAKLEKAILGSAEQPSVFALSRAEGESDIRAAALIEVLAEVKPAPKPGEETPAQLLSRANEPAKEPEKPATPAKKGNPLLEEAQKMFAGGK